MVRIRSLFAILLFTLVLLTAVDSEAVIYRFVNEKGVPTFADDLQKIPEQFRASAVMVSGAAADDAADAERARLADEARIRAEQQTAAPVQAEEPLYKRLVRSGIAIGVFVAMLFVLKNIHGLHEQAQLLFRIRGALILLLFVFLGFTHAKDIAVLFGKVGESVPSPIASIQEKSAERGKKAADAYKAIDRVLEQRVREEEARLKDMERKFDEAERGK
jgi:hypothetical protein